MEKTLILASASPRRKELLELSGYEFKIIPSKAEEISDGFSGGELARLNALAKAKDIYKQTGVNSVVIGADTVVCLNGDVLGKPKDEFDAVLMLKRLSGSKHTVITGYAVIGDNFEESGYCETAVEFRNLTENEIESYVATGEPLDKAGAYGIQERACLFVSHIEGDYFNIIGLPVARLCPVLQENGILPSWQKVLL